MSRISMDEQMMQGEIDRLRSELDHTRESIRAWTEKHAGQLNHSDIVYLMTLAGMKIL